MFSFNRGRKENSSSPTENDNGPANGTEAGHQQRVEVNGNVAIDRGHSNPGPADTHGIHSSIDIDTNPQHKNNGDDQPDPSSEISSSAYDSASYNQYVTQSFDSTKKEDPIMPPQNDGKQLLKQMYMKSPSAYDPQGSPNFGGIHAISVVTQAPEHGYGPSNEDDLSTLGDESIIRRAKQNQQKQLALKKKEQEHQAKKAKKQEKKKEKQKKNNLTGKQSFDREQIDKTHTRSTEQLSPTSAASGHSRDLSFSFSNVLDVHEKVPASSCLGHDITDDSGVDDHRDRSQVVGEKYSNWDDSDGEKTEEPFLHRNKWVIIRFIIGLSLFLLLSAAGVLVVSLIQLKKAGTVNDSNASIVGNGGESSDFFSNENPPVRIPDLLKPVPDPTSPGPSIDFPPDTESLSSEDIQTIIVTMSPTYASSTWAPTVATTTEPSVSPTVATTAEPSASPTISPTSSPSARPSDSSADSPTESPSVKTTTVSPVVPILAETNPGDTVTTIEDSDIENAGTDLRFVIANFSPLSLPFLEDSESAQYKAFDWMVRDPSYWSYGISRIVQRWTLAVFYYSTGGPNWKREQLPDKYAKGKSPWLTYSDECLWESSNQGTKGRICDSNNNYFAVHLRSIGLKGTIPAELALLSDHMRLLFLNDNDLTGTMPTELGLLTSMEKLNIQYNNMSGSIPSELGLWGSLTIAAMGNNEFSGSIPSELGSWGSMKTIGFENNNLTGTLPSELSNMPYVEKISLERNMLSGTIPYSFNTMYELKSLSLQTNDLTGEMQWGLCPGYYMVDELKADCTELKCDCCTTCFEDSKSAAVSLRGGMELP
eukprot:CAMPEP_0197186602 /NCGR_PEP_ID=MMETSP1423-20130617/14230_1 /TAXON_ID=476441 /ORGANISM="Pseudo-nitzschia heimii, Strain UNC1101" /LENGTH=820 /DNA_ID=CAMNT_0042637961 /DNA_START=72 /DNA_END=2534 /DNA_ORIENTATION=-